MAAAKEDGINWYSVASDSVIGGVLGSSGGLSKGTSKHLMTVGKNTFGKGVKNVLKTGKYYLSQTKNMFYKPLLKKSRKDAAKSATTSTSKFYAEKIAVKVYDRYFR